MQNLSDKISFKDLTLSEKFQFFEGHHNTTLESLSDKNLNILLRKIILNNKENVNIRKNALQTYVHYTAIGRIKVRQTLSLLIDEWDDNVDVFLKLQRLKDLYLFYNEEETEIETIYQDSLKEEKETELLSESFFNLGLINMQKGFSSIEKEETIMYLEKSKLFFTKSNEIIENRIDSKFYKISITIIVDLINGIQNIDSSNLKILASILFEKDAYTFNKNSINSFHIGFYRVLNTLNIIKQEIPNNWLNFRKNLSELYSQYSEFTNLLLKERLNKSLISNEFKNIVKTRFIEPYFTLSFQAQLSKIDSRLTELKSTNPEFDFLNEIRALVIDKKIKKVESEIVKNTLIKVFPNRSLSNIEESISKIDESNPFDYLSAFEELKTPSTTEYTDKLVSACIKLQGNRLYRGSSLEDDRNTFITNLLETDYRVKDQTRWSKSAAGKSAGEIDIFVLDSKGFPYSIIEALNLDSIKSDYIINHIDKIFKYDTTGLENNFILVYANSKNFDSLWKRYVKFISKHKYQYAFKSFQENTSYSFTDKKIGEATHIRKGKSIKLYHLMIDLND